MIQKPGYAKFQGLSNGIHIVYNFKFFGLGQNGFSPCALPRRPEHPLPEYFIKLKIFLKTRENLPSNFHKFCFIPCFIFISLKKTTIFPDHPVLYYLVKIKWVKIYQCTCVYIGIVHLYIKSDFYHLTFFIPFYHPELWI